MTPLNPNRQNRSDFHRSNDEFLRKMLGGEIGGTFPPQSDSRVPCNGNPLDTTPNNQPLPISGFPFPAEETPPENPPLPEKNNAPCGCSLAMVYPKKQPFSAVLPPEKALANGSQFSDLIKPFLKGCGSGGARK